jgi:tetratricopeptide (TPR) repeat protein
MIKGKIQDDCGAFNGISDLRKEIATHPKGHDWLVAAVMQPDRLLPLVRIAGIIKAISRFGKSTALIRWAACLRPNNASVLYLQGLQARHAGDVEGAISFLERAVRSEPNRPELWHTLARMLEQSGRIQRAIAADVRAARLPGCSVSAINRTFKWLKASKRYREYILILRERMLFSPSQPDLPNLLGTYFAEVGDRETGERWLFRALLAAPGFHMPFHQICKNRLFRDGDIGATRTLIDDPAWRQRFGWIAEFYGTCIDFADSGLTDGLIDRFRVVARQVTGYPGGDCLVRSDAIQEALSKRLVTPNIRQRATRNASSYTHLVSCDANYFRMFGLALARSSAASGVVRCIHFHIVGDALNRADEQQVGGLGIPVVFSREDSHRNGHARYCASARFIVAPDLLRELEDDLLITDCDVIMAGVIAGMPNVMSEFDVGLRIRKRFVPWYVTHAALLVLRQTEGGFAFAETLAATARLSIEQSTQWASDQATLVSVLTFLRRNRPDIRICNIEEYAELDGALQDAAEGEKAYSHAIAAAARLGA